MMWIKVPVCNMVLFMNLKGSHSKNFRPILELKMEEKVITESVSNTLYRYSHIKDLSAGDTITYKMRGNNPDLPAIADVYLGWY